ncbi:MAG: hypothetical protein KF883_10825 [Thermomicrobiales bacterium]|nr:hypothetical protein [Thermomicrobiales bacterium]
MTNRTGWIPQLLVFALLLLLASGVSWFVASSVAGDDSAEDLTAPLPPVTLDQRATVSLSGATITPVVSANATVVPDGEGGWWLEAVAPTDELAYRLLDPPVGVKALINGGPSGFDCDWVGLGQAGGGTAVVAESVRGMPAETTGVTMRCQIPEDVRVVAGMRGLMVLRMGDPVETEALPVTAVVGDAVQGQVIVVHGDSTTEVRTVELGVSDIYNIEITGGLEADELVLQNPTQYDFTQGMSSDG